MENASVLYVSETYFHDLNLLFCGYAACEPFHHCGPAVRPQYILHYILDGKGKFKVNQTTYYLEQGQGFLIEPELVTYYQADGDDPWTYVWIGFDGNQVPHHLNQLGYDRQTPIFRSDEKAAIEGMINEMLLFKNKDEINPYHLHSLFTLFLSKVSSSIGKELKETYSDESYFVKQAIHYMKMNYHQPVKVADLAVSLNVNRSYLSTLFQAQVGQTLKQYMTQLRIARARDLLHTTMLTIETIANSCGYPNPLVFTKAFKRLTGVNPTDFRKNRTDK